MSTSATLARRLALPAAASLLLSTLAWAQGGIFEITQSIESDFAEVETARLNGDCGLHRDRLRMLSGFLSPYIEGRIYGFRPAAREEYRTRLTEARARPCPPQRPAPRPTPTPTPLAPLPPTMTLQATVADFAAACGAQFEPARERMVVALDRAIRLATTAAERTALTERRRAVIAAPYRACRPKPVADLPAYRAEVRQISGELTAACGDRWSVLRLRMLALLDRGIAADDDPDRAINYGHERAALLRRDPPACGPPDFAAMRRYTNAAAEADRALSTAETLGEYTDCVPYRRELGLARAAIEAMQASGYAPPTPAPVIARYDAVAAVPCPRPRPSHAPAPQPTPTAVRACLGSFDNQVATGRMTCRCTGIATMLSIWGSNPYRGISNMCNAAVHAGAIPPTGLGTVTVRRVSDARAALGTERNGIAASNWDYAFENAFTFGAAAEQSAPPR